MTLALRVAPAGLQAKLRACAIPCYVCLRGRCLLPGGQVCVSGRAADFTRPAAGPNLHRELPSDDLSRGRILAQPAELVLRLSMDEQPDHWGPAGEQK